MTEQSNVIPFTQPTAWDRAREERNWLIFAILPADPKTGKKGKFPTDRIPSEYRHERIVWDEPVSVYQAARYTFSEAWQLVQNLQPPQEIECYRVGYLPRPDSALVIGDLDNCCDPVSGVISDWALEIMNKGSTYAEVSVSRTGIRLLMERQPGDDQHNSGERNDAGFFANGGKAAVLTFDRLSEAMPAPVPAIRDAILERRGVRPRRVTDGRTGEEYGDVSLDLLRAVVASIENDGRWGYDDWVALGHAIQTVDDGPEGYAIFRAWSERFPGPRKVSIARKWHRDLNPNGDVTFGTLVWMARGGDADGTAPDEVEALLAKHRADQKAAKALAAMPQVDGAAATVRVELSKLIGASPVTVDARLKELKAEHGIGIGAMRTELAQLQRSAAGEQGEYDVSHYLARVAVDADFANGRHLMFLHDDKYWRYDGRVWKRISIKQVTGYVTRRAEAMLATGSIPLPENKGLAAVVADAERLIRGTVARHDDPLRMSEAPPNVLNCTNCEIDLDTWKIRPHSPESYLRIAIDVEYDPSATAPVFTATMTDIMGGDQEMFRHLCEVMALIISPRKLFAALVLLIGEGSNGKTVLLEVLNLLMGDAIWPCDFQKIDHNNFASNALVNRCAVIDDDLDYHVEFPIAAVKKISEGKMMGGEVKGGEHFRFRCEVTPVAASNGFPPVRDVSYGFVRRANVIKFEQVYHLRNHVEEWLRGNGSNMSVEQLVEEGRVKLVDETLEGRIQNETSGILNIVLLALQRLRQRGSFLEPPAVIAARNEWREAADSVQRFVRQSGMIVYDPGNSILMDDFRRAYGVWCSQNQTRAKGSRQIASALKSAGFTVTKTNGVDYLRDYRFPTYQVV